MANQPASPSAAIEVAAAMDKLEHLAELSVARGCGYGGLAILTFMVGLSWDMVLATKVGGLLVLLVSMILVVKAELSPIRPHRRTELWLMLDHGDRPNEAIAQRVIGAVLRGCYLRFALHSAVLAALLLAMSLAFQPLLEAAP
jgi:hypothetical protein